MDISSLPFQIPLGALILLRVRNVLPANGNLGTTHITNGPYRLHPVEWNIGEAAGAVAAWCATHDLAATAVRNTPAHLADFQTALMGQLDVELVQSKLTPR